MMIYIAIFTIFDHKTTKKVQIFFYSYIYARKRYSHGKAFQQG